MQVIRIFKEKFVKKGPNTLILGTKLRAYFEGQGRSQAELAELYGVKQSWISRIFNGEFTSRSTVARKMCEEAGIHFNLNDEQEGINESKIRKIALQLLELKERDRRSISRLCGLLDKL